MNAAWRGLLESEDGRPAGLVGLRAVLSGGRDAFEIEVASTAGGQPRWFRMLAVPRMPGRAGGDGRPVRRHYRRSSRPGRVRRARGASALDPRDGAGCDDCHRRVQQHPIVRHNGREAVRVFVDGVPVQQVLLNLIRNAIEAMRESGRRELTVEVAPAGGTALFNVADADPGLAPAEAEAMRRPPRSGRAGRPAPAASRAPGGRRVPPPAG